MPRPTNKEELLTLSEANFQKMLIYIDDLSEEKLTHTFPDSMLNENIRDVLAHIHHWHLLFMNWYDVGMSGGKPEMPCEGYTWKTTGDLNKKIRTEYRSIPLDKILTTLKESYQKVRKTIALHTDEELFEKKRYKWTGSTSLGSYLVSATSSHYDWGLKTIKKGLK